MIPEAFITELRDQVPWALDFQVEQDLLLSRALVAEKLLFRGGTALHKLFFNPPGRYSEDIDLVQRDGGPIGQILDALRSRLDSWLGKPKREVGKGRITLLYRFESETAREQASS